MTDSEKKTLTDKIWEGKHYAFSAPVKDKDLTTTVSFEFIDLEKNTVSPKAKVGVRLHVGLNKSIIRPSSDLFLDHAFYQLNFDKKDIEVAGYGPNDMIIMTLKKALASRCFSPDRSIDWDNPEGKESRIACKYVLEHYFNKEHRG